MSKIGKSFTIDIKAYQWLQQYAKAAGKKESYVVNAALLKIKRELETWECSVCGFENPQAAKKCDRYAEGEFCKGERGGK